MKPDVDLLRAEFLKLTSLVSDPDLVTSASPMPRTLEQACSDIARLLPRVDSAVGAGLYDWAIQPAAYDEVVEVELQALVLAALAGLRADHPARSYEKPIAVRTFPGREFSASNVRSEHFDFIIVSSAHFQLLRDIAHVILNCSNSARTSDLVPPFAAPILELLIADPDQLADYMRPLQRHLVRLATGEHPESSPPLATALMGDKIDPDVRMSIIDLYNGSDAFVVLHELSHLLAGDPHTKRSLNQELWADHGALSLALAATDTFRMMGEPPEHTAAMAAQAIRLGGVATLQLFRCFHLLTTAHRLAAQLSDQAVAPWDGDLTSELRASDELEARLAGLPGALLSLGAPLKPILEDVTRISRGYEALVMASKATLLTAINRPESRLRITWTDPRRGLDLVTGAL